MHVGVMALLFWASANQSSFWIASLFCLVNLPLLAFRPEIRPEGLSYLFFALYYLLLWSVVEGRFSVRWLLLIPFLQAVWTNVHIFFAFGPLLVAVAAFDVWLQKRSTLRRPYLLVLAASCMACLVNPFGLEGAFKPLTIFQAYGYQVAENQSVLELQRSYDLPVLVHFEVVAALCVGLGVWMLLRSGSRRVVLARVLLLLFFAVLAWNVGRAVALFGLLAIPVGSMAAEVAFRSRSSRSRVRFERLAILGACALLLAPLVLQDAYLSPFSRRLGVGLAPKVQESAKFFVENDLQGPIFNNYDIGSYLVFRLFPGERVFVDNRPEAYSVSFLEDVYTAMQRDEELWKKMEQTFRFNVVYFSRRDRTPWAKPFLMRRIQDENWAPVYADRYALILVKRTEANRELIRRFEPKPPDPSAVRPRR
jgi:hypothetical protein